MSFWSEVARVLREPVVLKQSGLGVKFEVQFVRGRLQLRLPNKVERTVSPAELRAVWRLMEGGAGADVVKFASANGTYLAAIRSYLLELGISPGSDGDSADDVTTLETALVTQAAAMAPVIGDSNLRPGQEPIVDALTEQRDELARENARLNASLAEVSAAAMAESGRVAALEQEVERLRTVVAVKPAAPVEDALPAYLRLLEPKVKVGAIDETVANSLLAALRAVTGTPGFAILECRKALEQIARQSWRSTFATDELPQQTQFSSLMADLRDQTAIDTRRWNVAKTMYSVASEAAHVGAAPSTSERALLMFLAVFELRSGLATKVR